MRYRIENGKATEYGTMACQDMFVLLPDGALFVATGDQGKIFRVTSAGHGEVYYETGQSHGDAPPARSRAAVGG